MLLRFFLIVLMSAGTASAQEADPAAGESHFRTYCWQCHGRDARGDGPMAEILAIRPPDLTRLAAQNDGTFPTGDVAMKIDGRAGLIAHGGDMPLFGPSLDSAQMIALSLPDGQPMLASRPLADLVAYLKTLQTE